MAIVLVSRCGWSPVPTTSRSPGTIRAAIIATCPILMAAIGGLWSERAGVVNIGLEGQMILGTWGAAYFTYYYGPWVGVVGGALFGAIGGLLHALATVTFGVDHIVSGVAINIIGAGAAKFLAETNFADLKGGGPRQLIGLESPANITVPGLSDASTRLADKHWFFVSDIASFVGALTTGLSTLSIVVFSWWRSPAGFCGGRRSGCGCGRAVRTRLLRRRSGVNVYLYKYIAVTVSGGLAGIGGGFLTLVSSSGFTTGQTSGRGYIGLAAMIFGNWRPGGLLAGALMFGYTDCLRLRNADAVHALLLLLAIGLLAFAACRARAGLMAFRHGVGVVGALLLLWYLATETVPRDFTSMTPYVATMLVLALAAQRLRMPAADGLPYRKGSRSDG